MDNRRTIFTIVMTEATENYINLPTSAVIFKPGGQA
jgi:hypothetical protein|tara:strand:+ start:5942 stop:6049 length:108 start_codon:yes stop_codon:yes gene_type:complete